MTVEIGLVFAIVGVALYLFASQRLPLDVSALLIMVTLIVIPIDVAWLRNRGVDLPSAFPTVAEGLSGLSSPATVTVLAMFVLSAGVRRPGLMHVLGRKVLPLVGSWKLRLFLVVSLFVGVVSFVNITAAVAVSIPFVLDLCRQLGLRASRFLMPLSFFGMLTPVGTPTNILAATILADVPGLNARLGMFEFAHVGLIVLATGLVCFLAVGRLLLPDRDLGGDVEDDEQYVVELTFPTGSPWLGETLGTSGRASGVGVTPIRLVRNGRVHREDVEQVPLADGDIFQVRGTLRQVADLIASDQAPVLTDADDRRSATGDGLLVRVLLRNRLMYDGRTSPRRIGFWTRYRHAWSASRPSRSPPRGCRTRVAGRRDPAAGDLGAGPPRLRRHPDLVLLSEFEDKFDRRRMWSPG